MIFLEGGAKDSKDLRLSCQQAFRRLLDHMGIVPPQRRPKLIACGGRDQVYADFWLAHAHGAADFVAMWIDSEEPIDDPNRPWEHLQGVVTVAAWGRPAGAQDRQVLFMTTSMETWIAADRWRLRGFFGHALNENQLPPLQNLESRSRADVYHRLRQATQHCPKRYAKGQISFEIVEHLNPDALAALPSFQRARVILGDHL
jgi:hypothetical protein